MVVKKFVQSTLSKFGYRLTKTPLFSVKEYDGVNKESIERKLFFNVGAGAFSHPYWTNIDHYSNAYKSVQTKFLQYDLMSCTDLPIEPETAECFYSSHTVEHVSDDAVRNLFLQAHKALRRGGVIRITTPDIELNYSAYLSRDKNFYYFTEMHSKAGSFEHKFKIPYNQFSIQQLFLHQIAGQLSVNDIREGGSGIKLSDSEIDEILNSNPLHDACNEFTKLCKFDNRQTDNHINWFSYNKLELMLKDAGFKTCYKSGFGQSHFAYLRNVSYFDNTHPKISLYVEGIK